MRESKDFTVWQILSVHFCEVYNEAYGKVSVPTRIETAFVSMNVEGLASKMFFNACFNHIFTDAKQKSDRIMAETFLLKDKTIKAV